MTKAIRWPSALLYMTLLLLQGSMALAQVRLTRGPYLQNLLPTGITIRWRTDQPTDSRVSFGINGQLTSQLLDTTLTTEHIVTLKGLTPATKFSYIVGSSTTDWVGRNDQSFTTAPVAGATKSFRAWVLGDFGYLNTANQLAVRDQFLKINQSRPADIWLWLGDNAYNQGFDEQYQAYVFDLYNGLLRSLPFWSTPGNHEYTDPTNANIAYYDVITVPQQGEAGGVASGSKTNYSFDYGNVHFVTLDSYILENGTTRMSDTTGRQIQWLKRDLAANRQPWTIVFFHHPPYTKGSHNSDTESELAQIRQNLNPILERFNVDIVFCGHSHVYERSYLMKGHYGTANTFSKGQHAVSTSSARYDGSSNSCPIINKNSGTIYVVNGSGGALGGQAADFPHPAMVYSNSLLGGSMLLDVNNNRLDAQWVNTDGTTQDQFTIMKGVSRTQALTAEYGDTLALTASWPQRVDQPINAYRWAGGQLRSPTTRTIDLPANTQGKTRYAVRDPQGCLIDQFDVTVQQPPRITPTTLASTSICAGTILPITASVENTTKAAGWQYDVLLSNASGDFSSAQIIGTGSLTALTATLPRTLPGGSGYRIKVQPRGINYATIVAGTAFSVSTLPTATLNTSASVIQGDCVLVALTLTGDGPWRGQFSDGTPFNATSSPVNLSIKPVQAGIIRLSTVENRCGLGTVAGTNTITVLLPTGTASIDEKIYQIYPNPTTGGVTVNLNLPQPTDVDISVVDANGAIVQQKQWKRVQKSQQDIWLSTPGIYLFRLTIGDQIINQKIVRQ